jgi:UDP-N-acetylglucosamine acyltransferase
MEKALAFPKVNKTAILCPGAMLGENVEIGHGTIIGKNVIIGDGTKIGAYAVIDGQTTIGKNCVIHSHASIGSESSNPNFKGQQGSVRIGDHTQIREFVTITKSIGIGQETQIGSHCLLSAYSHVSHNCIIGNSVIMSNAVNLAEYVTIEDRATIGGITTIHSYVKIGRGVMVGGISKVVENIPPFLMVSGNPVKAFGLNNIGMKRAGIIEKNRRILKKAYKILYFSGLELSHAIELLEQQPVLCEELECFMTFLRNNHGGICTVAHESKTNLKQANG